MITRKTFDSVRAIGKTCRTSTKLIVTTLALLLIGTTIVAVTQSVSPPATRARICVKHNGQLRMLVDNNAACGPSEQLMEWVVGGQVTEIRPGQGLVGSRDNGIVSLALDPSILQGCAGCGRIFAGFNDGPADIFGAFGDEIVPASAIASLSLPAGKFAVFAKLTLRNVDSIDESHPVKCLLKAGADFDEARVVVENEQDRNDNGVPDRDAATSLVMNLMVVHAFDEPGGATLFCVDGTPNPDSVAAQDGDVKYEDLKLIGIEAASISNAFLGDN